MIIYNDDKYACISCIKGHRSSTCKRTTRVLVKVRTRGRPSKVDIRDVIIVGADSRVKRRKSTSKEQCCSDTVDSSSHNNGYEKIAEVDNLPQSCNKCSNRIDLEPIILTKAEQTQKAIVVDGKLNIILNDPELSGGEIKCVSEKEFLQNFYAPNTKDTSNNIPSDVSTTTTTITAAAEQNNNNVNAFDNGLQNSHMPRILRTKYCDPNYFTQSNVSLPIDNRFRRNISLLPHPTIKNEITSPTTAMSTTSSDPLETNTQLQTLDKSFHCSKNNNLDSRKLSVNTVAPKEPLLHSNCNWPEKDCECINCLIHRTDEEINNYLTQSGVRLPKILDLSKPTPYEITKCSDPNCQCSLTDCVCDACSVHPTEIIPFERFYYQGFNNITLRRKTIIKYKQKLIPSQYWWDFLTIRLPSTNIDILETIDLKDYFEELIEKHQDEFLNSESKWFFF